jgi:outer membrane protein TolC
VEAVMRASTKTERTIELRSLHQRCGTAAALLWFALTATVSAAPAGRAEEAAAIETEAESDGPRQVVRAPAISAVLASAYSAAGLDRDPKDSWLLRARLGGLVPWVTVRTTRDTSWQDDSSEVGHGTTLELRATWRLDRLVFDAKELQVAAVEAARRRERRRLASRVIRAYFTWRRAASIVGGDDRVATRVAEAAAELDALTDGWFSEQLARPAPGSGSGSGKPGGAGP